MAKSHSVLADIMQHHMPELYSSCKFVLPPPEIEYAESNLSSIFTSKEPTPPEGDHALYTWAIHIHKYETQAIPKGVVQAQHDGLQAPQTAPCQSWAHPEELCWNLRQGQCPAQAFACCLHCIALQACLPSPMAAQSAAALSRSLRICTPQAPPAHVPKALQPMNAKPMTHHHKDCHRK